MLCNDKMHINVSKSRKINTSKRADQAEPQTNGKGVDIHVCMVLLQLSSFPALHGAIKYYLIAEI